MKTPGFWYRRRRSPMAWLLAPLSPITAAATAHRLRRGQPLRLDIPVIRVGNLTAGGAGKTPVVAALATWLAARGATPGILSRGYGGRVRQPHRVDPRTDTAAAVGDEPLMLARRGWPVIVAPSRRVGAQALADLAPEITHLLLDDGHQDPSLQRDLSLVVISGRAGFGNRLCLPAGPLREPVAAGLARADAVVVNGADVAGIEDQLPPSLPRLTATIHPCLDALPSDARRRRWLPFAGLARPEAFFDTLQALGLAMVAVRRYSDHHPYTASEIERLQALAFRHRAHLITTEKDSVRLPATVTAEITVLPIDVTLAPSPLLARLLDPLL